ncbi:MAG TPA: hypothetical protein ACQGQH_08105 [Xylella sp.]
MDIRVTQQPSEEVPDQIFESGIEQALFVRSRDITKNALLCFAVGFLDLTYGALSYAPLLLELVPTSSQW